MRAKKPERVKEMINGARGSMRSRMKGARSLRGALESACTLGRSFDWRTSSETSPPLFITPSACWPISVPAATAARSISPVES